MTSSNQNISQAELWKDLAVKAQAGDQRSYEQLLKDLFPFIKKVIIGRLANPDWADDIAQDVLLSVHKSLKTYSPNRPFRPWLMAIVNFRKTDYLRKHYRIRDQKQKSVEMAEFIGSHVTNTTHAGEMKDIESALQALPEKQRQVFQKVKIEGCSIKEVAHEMDMSESAVKVSAHRTMKKLQKKLG